MTTSLAHVRQRYLLWSYEQEDDPNPEDFLEDPASEIDGEQTTEKQLERAVVRLASDGLIRGAGAFGREMPLRPRITTEGRACVEDFDGDTEQWSMRRRSGSTVVYGQRVNARGASGQVAAHSPATQMQQD